MNLIYVLFDVSISSIHANFRQEFSKCVACNLHVSHEQMVPQSYDLKETPDFKKLNDFFIARHCKEFNILICIMNSYERDLVCDIFRICLTTNIWKAGDRRAMLWEAPLAGKCAGVKSYKLPPLLSIRRHILWLGEVGHVQTSVYPYWMSLVRATPYSPVPEFYITAVALGEPHIQLGGSTLVVLSRSCYFSDYQFPSFQSSSR